MAADREAPSWPTNDRVRAERCDITRASDVARIVDLMEHELGGIDILVNRCRHKGRSDSLAIEPEHWDSVLDVNLKSVFFCPQAVAQSMVRRDRPGRVPSLNSEVVFPDSVAYCRGKGGVRALTMARAVGLGPYGIRVNAAAPGTIADTILVNYAGSSGVNRFSTSPRRTGISSTTSTCEAGSSGACGRPSHG